MKNHKAAVRDFDQAIKLNPNEVILYCNRGTAYLQTNDWKKSKKDFDSVITLRPDYVNAYLNRGIVKLNLKDLEAALYDFNQEESASIRAFLIFTAQGRSFINRRETHRSHRQTKSVPRKSNAGNNNYENS